MCLAVQGHCFLDFSTVGPLRFFGPLKVLSASSPPGVEQNFAQSPLGDQQAFRVFRSTNGDEHY
jgi:hypothetical protein